jgi:hypothetical protein
MSKTPIDPKDIRKGDLIRNEWADGTAFEFRAKHNGDNLGAEWRGGGRASFLMGATAHYLLDRPKPPVALPTKPTLAWVDDGRGRALAYWDGSAYADEVTQEELARTFLRAKITDFTPATAVPTEALNKFREVVERPHAMPLANWEGELVAHAFLSAVDEANA